MGRVKKEQPLKLVSKIAGIRRVLKLSQEEMIALIAPGTADARSKRCAISDFELGRRSPSVIELFYYAKAVRDLTEYKDFNVEDLIDDERDLPWAATGAAENATK